MLCSDLERYIEQEGSRPYPAEAEAHLQNCPACRSLLADLSAIQTAARALSAEDAETPPERVWASLRTRLEAEGLIRPEPATVGPAWLTSWWPVFSRPVLAGAYLALLFVAAAVVGVWNKPGLSPANVRFAVRPAMATLDSQLATVATRTVSSIPHHNPIVRTALRENLSIVDNFISLCEKSVREDPQNQLAREYLNGAYQQKAELLATAMDRGATGE